MRQNTGSTVRPFAGWRGVAVLLAALVALLAAASVAGAHAVLVSTAPVDGAVAEVAPRAVELAFSEPVTVPVGGIRVFDAVGERVDGGDAATTDDPAAVVASLPPGLGDGTYVVTWRVVSADGHPVRGAFVFSVGEAAAVDDTLLARLLAGEGDRPFAAAAVATRWATYATALLAAGSLAFLWLVAPPPTAGRERLASIGTGSAGVAAVATVLAVPLQAAVTTGLGWAAFANASALGDTLTGPVGRSAVVRLVGLVVVVAALRRTRDPSRFAAFALPGAGLVLGSMLLEGHTLTSEPTWLAVLGDALHVTAAAVWFGGLALLGVVLRQRDPEHDPVEAARLVARFSGVALVAVAAVSASGLALAWVEVRALRALTTTTYGWTLLVKVALAVLVLGVAAYNNRRLVPAVAARGEQRAWRLLRRTVRVEVVGLVAVLAVTSVLVGLQPARDAAGVTGAYSTWVDLDDGYELNLVVDPNRAGRNELHLFLLDATGRPAAEAEDAFLRLFLPAQEIGPIERRPEFAGPGHWIHIGNELSIPGAWEVEAIFVLSRFDALRASIPVTVNP